MTSNHQEVKSSKENATRPGKRDGQRSSVFSKARMSFVRYVVSALRMVARSSYKTTSMENSMAGFSFSRAWACYFLTITDLEENEEQLLKIFEEPRERTLKARQMSDESKVIRVDVGAWEEEDP